MVDALVAYLLLCCLILLVVLASAVNRIAKAIEGFAEKGPCFHFHIQNVYEIADDDGDEWKKGVVE